MLCGAEADDIVADAYARSLPRLARGKVEDPEATNASVIGLPAGTVKSRMARGRPGLEALAHGGPADWARIRRCRPCLASAAPSRPFAGRLGGPARTGSSPDRDAPAPGGRPTLPRGDLGYASSPVLLRSTRQLLARVRQLPPDSADFARRGLGAQPLAFGSHRKRRSFRWATLSAIRRIVWASWSSAQGHLRRTAWLLTADGQLGGT